MGWEKPEEGSSQGHRFVLCVCPRVCLSFPRATTFPIHLFQVLFASWIVPTNCGETQKNTRREQKSRERRKGESQSRKRARSARKCAARAKLRPLPSLVQPRSRLFRFALFHSFFCSFLPSQLSKGCCPRPPGLPLLYYDMLQCVLGILS